jgi:plastocyanin
MRPLDRFVGMLLLSAVIACGDGDRAAEIPDASEAGLLPAPASSSQTIEVMIRGMAFVPPQIEVAPGSTVVFTNAENVVHTATSRDGSWSSGDIPPGGSWRRRFIEPGIYPYYCLTHPLMMGALVVR